MVESTRTTLRKREQRKNSIRVARRPRVSPSNGRSKSESDQRQITHQPILLRPVYTKLRSQVCPDYPRVSRLVLLLVLESAIAGKRNDVSVMIRRAQQSNLFAGTSGSRTRERGYGHRWVSKHHRQRMSLSRRGQLWQS